jgi:hypothetical protein
MTSEPRLYEKYNCVPYRTENLFAKRVYAVRLWAADSFSGKIFYNYGHRTGKKTAFQVATRWLWGTVVHTSRLYRYICSAHHRFCALEIGFLLLRKICFILFYYFIDNFAAVYKLKVFHKQILSFTGSQFPNLCKVFQFKKFRFILLDKGGKQDRSPLFFP